MLYNIINKQGTRLASINSPRIDRQTAQNYADNGLFIQICDSTPVIRPMGYQVSGYLIGAVLALVIQVVVIGVYLL